MVPAGIITPGAISISLSSAVTVKVLSLRPSGKVETVPVSQSVSIAVGSKPLRSLSTSPTVIIAPWPVWWPAELSAEYGEGAGAP